MTINGEYRRSTYSGNAQVTSPSVLTALRSGALNTLVINNWRVEHDVFECVSLSGLTHLELRIECFRGGFDVEAPTGVMAALATATLPLLSKLSIWGGKCTLEEGDIKSLSAFSQLLSLSIESLFMEESDWKWFIVNILPTLKEFRASDKKLITSIHALDPSLATWPLLQKLTLGSSALVDVLPLAPHFPNITALKVRSVKTHEQAEGPKSGHQAVYQTILDAARYDLAWTHLESLWCERRWGWWLTDADVAVLERAWPRASIYDLRELKLASIRCPTL